MSRRGTAEEKTAKSDPIYRNRLVNMLVNHILKHGKNHWLGSLFSFNRLKALPSVPTSLGCLLLGPTLGLATPTLVLLPACQA